MRRIKSHLFLRQAQKLTRKSVRGKAKGVILRPVRKMMRRIKKYRRRRRRGRGLKRYLPTVKAGGVLLRPVRKMMRRIKKYRRRRRRGRGLKRYILLRQVPKLTLHHLPPPLAFKSSSSLKLLGPKNVEEGGIVRP